MLIALSIALYILGGFQAMAGDWEFEYKNWRDWAMVAIWPFIILITLALFIKEIASDLMN